MARRLNIESRQLRISGISQFRLTAFEALEARELLATFDVTKATDNGNITVPFSLSWAIDQANTSGGTAPDTVRFLVTSQTVSLSGLLPIIRSPITFSSGTGVHNIVGAGVPFVVDSPISAAVRFTGLVLRNFQTDAISVLSTTHASTSLAVDNCIIRNNTGSGISINAPILASISLSRIYSNGVQGVFVSHPSPSSLATTIEDCFIGTDGGNGKHGIFLARNVQNANITRNDIRNNGTRSVTDNWDYDGIGLAKGDTAVGDALSQNRIQLNYFSSNYGLPIDLGDAKNSITSGSSKGFTPNDPDDNDTGPNGLLNFPVIRPHGTAIC